MFNLVDEAESPHHRVLGLVNRPNRHLDGRSTPPTNAAMNTRLRFALVLAALTATACGDDAANDADTIVVPETYTFAGRGGADSSVAYSGQTYRHLLIEELKQTIGSLTGDIDDGSLTPTDDGDVVVLLYRLFRFDSDVDGTAPVPISTTPAPLQATYDDVSTDKDLVGKIAGNDSVTDHRDFAGGAFDGWQDASIAQFGGGIDTPEALFTAILETLEDNAIRYANADTREAFDGTPLPVHVTENGVDLQQLAQKLLTVSLTLSQGLDDYLDDDVDGKGLLSAHEVDGDDPYTVLEHQWDEAFGYFGAARDALALSDDDVAAGTLNDTNGDGAIDLTSEWTAGLASNAAKRDLGAVDPTDFSGDAMRAFLAGRALLAATEGALSTEQLDTLRTHRDAIATAWESALAATVIHYINASLDAYDAYDADPASYSFLDHAKAWSELKGFALGFQFHRNSPMLSDFERFHTLIGDAPALPNAANVTEYRDALLEARGLVQTAFGFSDANAAGL